MWDLLIGIFVGSVITVLALSLCRASGRCEIADADMDFRRLYPGCAGGGGAGPSVGERDKGGE